MLVDSNKEYEEYQLVGPEGVGIVYRKKKESLSRYWWAGAAILALGTIGIGKWMYDSNFHDRVLKVAKAWINAAGPRIADLRGTNLEAPKWVLYTIGALLSIILGLFLRNKQDKGRMLRSQEGSIRHPSSVGTAKDLEL